ENEMEKPVDGTTHVTFEDTPNSHYTHDFCFKVKPDPAFEYLLAIDHHADSVIIEDPTRKPGDQPKHQAPPVRQKNPDTIQAQIEVEWECGLAEANDGN